MFRFLPKTNALSMGSLLWIIQTPHHSDLAKKMDWHLHFSFMKSNTPSDAPLLIESSCFLPNKHTLFIPFKKEMSVQWIKEAFHSWNKLKKPSLKFFIPPSISKKQLINHWPYENLPYKIHIVFE